VGEGSVADVVCRNMDVIVSCYKGIVVYLNSDDSVLASTHPTRSPGCFNGTPNHITANRSGI
jgi:hypothetical protein